MVNLGATYSSEKKFVRAIELYHESLTQIDCSSLSTEDRAKVKTSALYNLGKAYKDTGDGTKAHIHFEEALISAIPYQRPAIMFAMYDCLTVKKDKLQLLTRCVDEIISGNVRPNSSQSEGTLGLTASVLYSFLREAYLVSRPLFDKLFAYSSTLDELNESSNALLLRLAFLSAAKRDFDSAVSMARDVVEKSISGLVGDKVTEFESFRLLSLLCRNRERQRYQLKYVECLKSGFEPKIIDSADLQIFTDLASASIKSNEPNSALEYINLAKQFKNLVPRDQIAEFAAVNYFEMLAHRSVGAWSKLKESSQETLTFLGSLKGCSSGSRLVNAEGLKQIEEFAKSNLEPARNLIAESFARGTTRKYGRNEKVSVRYQDGRLKSNVKYKHVEADLAQSQCVLLEEQAIDRTQCQRAVKTSQ